MDLRTDARVAEGYRSRAQIARVVTEQWSANTLYCPACPSRRLSATPANTQAVDFRCADCDSPFQLKSGTRWNERRIPDAGYDAMMRAIVGDRVPNLFVMSYSANWAVENLLGVPSFVFSTSAIEKRKPLRDTARRAGWVGCNIRLYTFSA